MLSNKKDIMSTMKVNLTKKLADQLMEGIESDFKTKPGNQSRSLSPDIEIMVKKGVRTSKSKALSISVGRD